MSELEHLHCQPVPQENELPDDRLALWRVARVASVILAPIYTYGVVLYSGNGHEQLAEENAICAALFAGIAIVATNSIRSLRTERDMFGNLKTN
jgi:hypothetical protein